MLKKQLLDGISYEDIVVVWQQKRKYLDTFPTIDKNFKALEVVLFKSQFKAHRTQSETDEVLQAYTIFKSTVSGALNEK